MNKLVIIKGAGDLATGVAHKLYQCGFSVLLLEIPKPTVIRRAVAFAEAVYEGMQKVEGVTATLARCIEDIDGIIKSGNVAVLVDPHWLVIPMLQPLAVVDAIVAKYNIGTNINEAPITIGLGPGFSAGSDVLAVIETNRGHNLGRVIYNGMAAPNTGEPGDVGGHRTERLLRSPTAGQFTGYKDIGSIVRSGEVVAMVGNSEVHSPINGVLRGILRQGLYVSEGFKIGDVDPRSVREYCFTISDKARSVAGGVLEAILHLNTGGSYG